MIRASTFSVALFLMAAVISLGGCDESVSVVQQGQVDTVGGADGVVLDAGAKLDAGDKPFDAGSASDTVGSDHDVGPGGCLKNMDCDQVKGLGPCNYGICNTATGKCALALKDKGSPCDDGSACTSQDACDLGQCKGISKKCDDGDPCTEDLCDPKTGKCEIGEKDLCQCQLDKDCAGEEDGDLCNGTLKCDLTAKPHKCVVDAATVVDCSKAGDSDCMVNACVPKTGLCVLQPVADGGACEDGSVCTSQDTCKGGLCFGGTLKGCDDNNPCTADSCDPKKGCLYLANKAACDDGDACTKADACVDGICQATGGTLSCDDDNPCTDDTCDPKTGCVHLPNKVTCDDGNVCTANDLCVAGKCVSGISTCGCQADADCVKFDNDDLCDGVLVCDKTGFPFVCKVKAGSVVKCDASKNTSCLKNKCDAKTGACGLQPLPKGTGCDDGNKCTLLDTCMTGLCVGAKEQSCDDGNPCTADLCDKSKGCQNTAVSSACDDKNACTVSDKCKDKKCVAGEVKNCNDGNPCTKDACDPIEGCSHVAIAGNCNDSDACTASDQCVGGKCVGKDKTNCDDKNACTNDKCDSIKGCIHTHNLAKCEDGSACTVGDKCSKGACVSGNKLNCDDKNVCTTDSCDPSDFKTACQNAPNAASCDDGSKCTQADLCQAGKCVSGASLSCDDGEVCTTDSCDPAKGCVHLPANGTCTDGDPCTAGDHCKGGKCQPLNQTNCDDGNVCTFDTCDAKQGCVHAPTAGPCDDGDVCTGKDTCIAGKCTAGPKLPYCCKLDSECNDEVSCTTDKCQSNVCVHTSSEDEVLLNEGFEGTLEGWTIASDAKNNVTWQVVTTKAAKGKASLYMGNPKLGNYDGDDFVATVKLPKLKVPMGSTRVSFNVWAELEDNDDEFDVLYVLVNNKIYDELSSTTAGWKSVAFDVSSSQGQEIQIALEFESGDELKNKGAGIWIDNLRIEQPKCGGETCKTHANCDDLNDCTGDLCVAGKCQHAPMPSHTIFYEDFDDVTTPGNSTAQGWTFSATTKTNSWLVSTKRARSGGHSLHCGALGTGGYGAGKAQAKLPKLRVPTKSTTTLVFYVWMDVKDGGCTKDRVRVYAGTKNDVVATSCASTSNKWVMVTADLTPYASFYITPTIEFDTVDGLNNVGEGVYVDDVSVVHEWVCNGLDADFEANYAFNFLTRSSSPTVRWHITSHDKQQGIRSLQAANPATHTYDGPATTAEALTGLPICTGGIVQFYLLNKVADKGCDADVFSVWMGNLELFKKCGDTKGWELVSLNLSKYQGLSIPLSFRFVSNGTNNKANGAYIDAMTLECP